MALHSDPEPALITGNDRLVDSHRLNRRSCDNELIEGMYE